VDDVLKAILTPLPGEEAAITARPRAVLATLCLADEPNASETMVDRILQTFAWQVNKGDGEGSISSSLDAAAIELATSRWGQRLRAYLVQEFSNRVQEFSNRDRDARTRLSAGGLCAMAITATIPQAEGGVQAWLAEQATHLTSGTEATAIEAALGIMELAFERKNNVSPEITAVAGSLMAMLRGSAPAGCASAWALNWLNDGQMKDKAWRPSTIDREPMITLVSDPAADVGAVR